MNNRQNILLNIIYSICFIIPTIGFYAPVSITIISPILAVFMWFYIGQKNIHTKIFYPLVILCIWGIISILWSPLPAKALKTVSTLLIFITFTAVIITAKSDRILADRIGYNLIFGSIFVLIVAWCDFYFNIAIISRVKGYPLEVQHDFTWALNVLDRGYAIIAILLWPMFAFLIERNKNILLSILIIVAVSSIFIGYSGSGKLIFVVCLPIFILLYNVNNTIYSRIIVYMIPLSFVILVPLLLFLPSPQYIWDKAQGNMPTSLLYRLVTWDYAKQYIKEKPVFGHGIESSRFIGSKGDRVEINFDNISGNPHGVDVKKTQALPLHPHNIIVQVWLELGLVGLFILFIFITMLSTKISNITDNKNRAVAVSVFISIYIIEMLNVGVWQSWWLATIVLILFFVKTIGWNENNAKNK